MIDINKELIKKLDRQIIYESEWISLFRDKVEMPNGDIIDSFHKLHYPFESVSVVIINENDEILMIQSRRYSTNSIEWEIPAGRIERNETKEEAARRECIEETGCTLKDLTYLCYENPSNGMSDQKVHIYGAKVKSEVNVIDNNEVKAKQWIKKENIIEMLKNNDIYCGVSVLALLYAIQFYL